MDRRFAAGLAGTSIGLVGYALGTVVAYPGRSFSITLAMVGVTLLAIGVGGE
ncbi:hypothetical protein HTZ84_17180 [Haloterrigena sp. SYSU A558-1]|uniref:Uncharacterized protein n=1 Tax=Haloterrigena gelatinilytica TaxID=2741724 RepID=A0A8J8GJ47_9EURY|nr:hypothetical protein [Haloterrigena gelatinilytica]NUB90165.1 hypothetical protein [Haloterrigena gelatinilytica]NUC74014.1 hypothetical protein [Haloterrigena gelatinilytica]